MIAERIFSVIDRKKKGFIDAMQFCTFMFKLYSADYDVRIKFIFDLYDFDDDGVISKEDIHTLLSHFPTEIQESNSKGDEGKYSHIKEFNEVYNSIINCRKQLYKMTDICFKKEKTITLSDFNKICESESSDMFLALYSMIKKRLPSINQFKHYSKIPMTNGRFTQSPYSKLLASPKILSSFSPLSRMVTRLNNIKLNNNQFEALKIYSKQDKFLSDNAFTENMKYGENTLRMPNSKFLGKDVIKSPSVILKGENTDLLYCECGKELSDLNLLICQDCQVKEKFFSLSMEIYKRDKSGSFQKFFGVLDKKELHLYKLPDGAVHKSLYILSGCFFEEEANQINYDGNIFYGFSLIWGKREKRFGFTNKDNYDKWVGIMKKIICYTNFLDFYDLKEIIGKGKFGVVHRAIHKKTKQNVAVKIMSKSKMEKADLELLFREIEILKLCNHPNIIRLIDIFENRTTIFIVMEFLDGGDLFLYLERKKFNLSENRASELILSLVNAVHYLHSMGIIHRDLKPENILVIDKKDDSDIKIVDFGLSKILGPAEKCDEQFGTLNYVAPEILMQKHYGKPVDIWSIGMITHLLLGGFLIFDSEKDEEIIRKTIFMDVMLKSARFNKISQEGKDFLLSCLSKNPNKRPTVEEALAHPWFSKFKLTNTSLNSNILENVIEEIPTKNEVEENKMVD